MTQESSLNAGISGVDVFVISDGKPRSHLEDMPKNENGKSEEPADFETAIKATGFGKFNILVFLLAIPSSTSILFAQTTMAYILPISQCDLDLTLQNKGMLNAITFIGMISSSFLWGYLADTTGRKKLLVMGYLLDGFFVIVCGFSQQYAMLLISKFMSGFVINGPFAAMMSYVNELHCARHRALIPFINGIIYSIASIIMPLLGWLIFSEATYLSFFNGFIVLRSWNIFLFVCALPSCIAGLGYIAMPESPKFLMTMGENQKALKIFQTVYSYNTGNSPDTYPIKVLIDEIKLHENNGHISSGYTVVKKTKIQALKEGWQQMRPLFSPPYLGKIVLAFSIQFAQMLGLHTLRLWLPQIFAAINDFLMFHGDHTDADLCKMLEMVGSNNTVSNEVCFVNYSNDSIYTNNIIVGFVGLILYVAIAAVVGKLGKRFVLVSAALTSGICGLCMYFSRNEATAVSLMSIYNSLSGISVNVLISIAVDMFPTTLRTMTVSLLMTFGRSGAMFGNLVFPFLLDAGCLPPFLTIGSLMIGGALLSMLLPKTDMKALD